MSFTAVLNIDQQNLNVLACDFAFNQQVDTTGKPSSKPQGGIINVVIESTMDTSLFEWMISNHQTRNGAIIFKRRDVNSRMKDLEFKDAYCVHYREMFVATGEHPMQIQLTLSAKELKMGNARYANPWPVAG
jgi:hypothetical protein